MRKIIKENWKQAVPIPEGYTALILGEDDNGNTDYLNLEKEGWVYFSLMLVDVTYSNGETRSDIALCFADSTGYRGLEYDYQLARRERLREP